jgi:hypothetical protein
MKRFSVQSNKPTQFKSLIGNIDRINIRGVQSSNNNINSLFSPINIETTYGADARRSYYIHTHAYYSNTRPGIATDCDMNVIIPECSHSTIEIQSNPEILSDAFVLDFFYEPIVPIINEVIVYQNQQIEDITFSLHPASRMILREKFPNAIQARSVSGGYGTMYDFQMIYGSIFYSMFKALTGLTFYQVCLINKVSLVDAASNQVIADSLAAPLLLDLAKNRYE